MEQGRAYPTPGGAASTQRHHEPLLWVGGLLSGPLREVIPGSRVANAGVLVLG